MPSSVPAAPRRRVVFERRTPQSSQAHATSPQHNRAGSRHQSSASDEARDVRPPPSPAASAARAGNPLPQRDPTPSIQLPRNSDPEPSASVDPATAKYLFPSPPPRDDSASAPMSDSDPPAAAAAGVPLYFLGPPVVEDEVSTESSIVQQRTAEECLPFLNGTEQYPPRNAAGVPELQREVHVDFLKDSLENYPARYVGIDASRPWVVYWALNALKTLGEDVSEYEERTIQNLAAAQNPDGGIGGGHGYQSHIAPTYAGVLSLAIFGEKALDCIDRRDMWRWLGKLKQADGGFSVCEGAEIDIRGAYCSMTVLSLLNLPLELPPDAPARGAGLTSFTDRLPEWISRCQTYEGGMSATPGTEAHGAYAFCALACACILGDPQDIIPKILDLPLLIKWLSARQYAPEGGFSGRTNKLVDGCYSHWVGGCWPLIEEALSGSGAAGTSSRSRNKGLFSREGLIRYILCCCQSDTGGLRDKPSKLADGYHSNYVLAGLSSAQHNFRVDRNEGASKSSGYPFCWRLRDEGPTWEGLGKLVEPESVVEPVHPVFVIPFEAVERARAWSLSKTGF